MARVAAALGARCAEVADKMFLEKLLEFELRGGKAMKTEKKFWLVWNAAGLNPSVRHESEVGAVNEAYRIAKKAPGAQVFVLEAKVFVEASTHVETTILKD